MSLDYDDVAKICSSKERLIFLAERKGASGRFWRIVFCVFERKLFIHLDSSFSKVKVCWRCSNGKYNKKLLIREGSWFKRQTFVGADS